MNGFYVDGVVREESQTLKGMRGFVLPFILALC